MKDFKESRSGFSGYGWEKQREVEDDCWEKKGRLKKIVRIRKGG